MRASDWEYDTGREDSVSIALVTGGAGRLYFVNPETEEHIEVGYSVLSVGAAKGAAFNVAKSLVSTPSGGITKLRIRAGFSFDIRSFPCDGEIISGGLTAGIFSPSFIDDSGASISLLTFVKKKVPFAWVPIWGKFSSILPSGGVSLGRMQYQEARSYKMVPDVLNANVG